MATKLARQMALKKKLEEEYRQANERLNDRSLTTRKYYPMKFNLDAAVKYSPVTIRKRNIVTTDTETEEEIPEPFEREEENKVPDINEEDIRRQELEEENRRKELEEEARKKELEERLRLREEEERKWKQKLEDERKKKMKEKLKRAEAKKRREDRIAKKHKEMEDIRNFIPDDKSEENDQAKRNHVEEVKDTEEKIKQLELSIATLDMELERFDLEQIRDRTRKVVKRMSLVMQETELPKLPLFENDDEEDINTTLQTTTVKGFIQNQHLWNKYVSKRNVA